MKSTPALIRPSARSLSHTCNMSREKMCFTFRAGCLRIRALSSLLSHLLLVIGTSAHCSTDQKTRVLILSNTRLCAKEERFDSSDIPPLCVSV